MPKFAVISPTNIDRKKPEAWENFKTGSYIAMVSRIKEDLSNKSIDEILDIVKTIYSGRDLTKRLKEFSVFFSLSAGDYVAVKNANDGLFGIGMITGDYYFRLNGHNTGSTNPDDFYNHFYPVKWLVTTYMKRKSILRLDERCWPPGVIISLLPGIPEHVKRILANKRKK